MPSVVMMPVLFTNSDYIKNMMVMLMNNIVFVNLVMPVIDYMTVVNYPSVIRAVELPSISATV